MAELRLTEEATNINQYDITVLSK